MKTCTNCGASMPDDVTSCTACGSVFAVSKASRGTGKKNGPPKDQPVGQSGNDSTTVVYQPVYIQQPAQIDPDLKSKAITALILGLVGLLLSIGAWYTYGISAILGLILSIIGIVFGVKARNRIPSDAPGRGIATAGLTFSILGTIISGIMTLAVICLVVGVFALCASTPSAYVDYYAVLFSLIF